MYAVFVIAAILLSASPMHIRTVLAALPAVAPGHQFTSDESEHASQSGKPHLPSATRVIAHTTRSTDFLLITQAGVAPKPTPIFSMEDTSLLEHAPNAP